MRTAICATGSLVARVGPHSYHVTFTNRGEGTDIESVRLNGGELDMGDMDCDLLDKLNDEVFYWEQDNRFWACD